MGLIRGYIRIKNSMASTLSYLLLLSGLIGPGIPESRANFCQESLVNQDYPVDIFNVGFSDIRTLSIKRDVPVPPFTKKAPQHNDSSGPLSDQCYFKEGYRVIADKGPKIALLAISGNYSVYLLIPTSFIYDNPFVVFSSRNGNSLKIRPPPFS